MKKALVVLAGLMAVSLWVLAADAPAVKKFETKMGTVTFEHQKHVDAGLKCVECHHSTKEGETPQACTECHDLKEAKDKAPKLYDAIHGGGAFGCSGCHQKMADAGKKAGPLKKDCKSCHVKG